MTDATNPAQMHVRLVRFLPRDMARAMHPKAVDEVLAVAWVNGWRDAEWLATYALEGTEHPTVRDAAAVFVSRLKQAAAMPCPTDATPEPARTVDLGERDAAPPDKIPAYVDQCRKALGR